ncbi:spermidine/putrescine transport system substrate-binding protein [Alkalispirillum mobile]|uniref:Spermidine/putrescine transport system substrate-binding protein n=1 Tax=Alkalispirillum mobile TaxID=85925 RepID=A0A498C6R1_9GAMM|nr:PotD/PotF family extracellular solute-binding protein [Alkalispirillum mobile]RLK51565.1 spermidine/putrescine transport system substrate-binding protein [Alkalispirillum mobile]
MSHTKFNRRRFLQSAGALAGGAAMMPLMPGQAWASRDRELSMLVWEGYNSPNVLDPFRREFSARVSASNVTSDPDAVNRLRAGETRVWDLINLNNPWARQMMYPEGLIKPLDQERFRPYFDDMLPEFHWPYPWAMSDDGNELLGVVQRFGPLSFVVNTDRISRATAEDEGFNLFLDSSMSRRYGVLTWANWNIFHMCVTAGFSPFKEHTEEEMSRFREVAEHIFANARFLSDDHLQMNQALITGEIDAYFTGGTYSCSVARADGFSNVRGITPKSGPIDGKGGIVWVELTSVVNNPNLSPLAETFLEYIMRPDVCHDVAFAEGSHNPVAQMGDPDVLGQFSSAELDALQYDSLEEDLARCADYDVNPDYAEMLEIYTEARRNA